MTVRKVSAFLLHLLVLFPVFFCHTVVEAESQNQKTDIFFLQPEGMPLKKSEIKYVVPASVVKIATAAYALWMYGENHRFSFSFHTNTSGDLIVIGNGHPALTSDELRRCTDKLPRQSFRHLVLDNSAFSLRSAMPGRGSTLNPYDAPNSAISVNYNSIAIKVSKGGVTSGEVETPLTPYAKKRGSGLPIGSHRVSVGTNEASVLEHFGQLLKIFVEKNGSRFKAPTLYSSSTEPVMLLLKCESEKPLSEILEAMLEYSNNFTANQLFLLGAARISRAPVTLSSATAAFSDFLINEMGFSGGFLLEDGAGLSRENRMSLRDMSAMLKYFKPYFRLLPSKDGLYYKSGSLTGVSNLAGYVVNQNEVSAYFGFFSAKNLAIPDRLKFVKSRVKTTRN